MRASFQSVGFVGLKWKIVYVSYQLPVLGSCKISLSNECFFGFGMNTFNQPDTLLAHLCPANVAQRICQVPYMISKLGVSLQQIGISKKPIVSGLMLLCYYHQCHFNDENQFYPLDLKH